MHLWFINAGFEKLFLWRAKEAAVSVRDTCLLFDSPVYCESIQEWLESTHGCVYVLITFYFQRYLNKKLYAMQKKCKNVKKMEHSNIATGDKKKYTHSLLEPSSPQNFIYVFCFWLDAYMPQSTCGGQRTDSLQEMAFSFHHVCLTIQLMPLGLVASTFTHWVTSLAILGIVKWKHVFELPVICIILSCRAWFLEENTSIRRVWKSWIQRWAWGSQPLDSYANMGQ